MNKQQLNKKAKQLQAEIGVSLQKLEDLDTTEVAFKEFTKLFGEYQHEEFVKLFVARIQQTFRSKHSSNLLRENVIVLIGIFFASYKSKCQPHVSLLLKLVVRHFELDRESLQQSCARTVKELYEHALKGLSRAAKQSLLLDPLLDHLLTAQGQSQASCCLALYELLLFTVHEDRFEDFHAFADRVLEVLPVASHHQKQKIDCEEIVALRTLIIRNCHDSLLNEHPKLDSHEFYNLLTVLEDKNRLPQKLESQVKSEVLLALETFLSRKLLRSRIDEEVMGQFKKALAAASYSRLPRVRSTAKPLLLKLNSNTLEEISPHFRDGRMAEPPRREKIYIGKPEDLPQDDPSEEPEGPNLPPAATEKLQPASFAVLIHSDEPQDLHPTDFGGEQLQSAPAQFRQIDSNPNSHHSKHPESSESSKNAPLQKSAVIPAPAAQLPSNNLNLQFKRDQLKRLKQREEERTSNENLRGLYLIDEDLKTLTKGKGWAPNIRARNYLRAHTGGLTGGGLAEAQPREQVSADLLQRRANRSRGRAELHHLLTQSKSKERLKDPKRFATIDEDGEKRRKRRLLFISKGINPEDPQAEEKLRALLEREEYEENNVFEKCTRRSQQTRRRRSTRSRARERWQAYAASYPEKTQRREDRLRGSERVGGVHQGLQGFLACPEEERFEALGCLAGRLAEKAPRQVAPQDDAVHHRVVFPHTAILSKATCLHRRKSRQEPKL